MSHDGRGVARVDGKTTFIRGALPGERVEFVYTRKHRARDEGRCVKVLEASPERVEPRCVHFRLCGGCSLQHQAADRQIHAKARILRDNLERLGQVKPEAWLDPLIGPYWGYRHKARLGVKYVPKKGGALVGFREVGASKVAELSACEVLHPYVGRRLTELRALINAMDVREWIPQIEVAVGDDHAALIFRHLAPLSDADRETLRTFGVQYDMDIFLQSGGPETVAPLDPDAARTLRYRLPAWDVEIAFRPDDFTQVNAQLNRAMVARALDLLALRPQDRVLDLFCGLGNFTLPMARQCRRVTGVEGDAGLVARARENAERNHIRNVEYHAADLIEDQSEAPWAMGPYDKLLLDPPRSGALEMLPLIARLAPERIVYVSCHPGSLARDAGILVREHGYRLAKAGVMDMFPHTAHVESIALFERSTRRG